MAMIFEWDSHKQRANLRRHRISFGEATSVFLDPLVVTIADPDHSAEEQRFVDVEMSFRGRLLVVSYTERGDRIRLISARSATASERSQYEEAK